MKMYVKSKKSMHAEGDVTEGGRERAWRIEQVSRRTDVGTDLAIPG